MQTKLEEATRRVERKIQRYLNPVWVPPPVVSSDNFCEDYVYEWTMCYAIGSLNVNNRLDWYSELQGRVVG